MPGLWPPSGSPMEVGRTYLGGFLGSRENWGPEVLPREQ